MHRSTSAALTPSVVLPSPLRREGSNEIERSTRRAWLRRGVGAACTVATSGAFIGAIGAVGFVSGCGSRGNGSYAPPPSTGTPPPNGRAGGAANAPATGTTTPVPTTPSPSPTFEGKSTAALEAERKYLADWFSGTPVNIAFERDGSLRVEVPVEFAFFPAQNKLKPAMIKVLDHVGASLRRVREARVHIAAPDDKVQAVASATVPPPTPSASPSTKAPTETLPDKRGVVLREQIVARGVNLIRVAPLATSPMPAVVIRMVMPAAG